MAEWFSVSIQLLEFWREKEKKGGKKRKKKKKKKEKLEEVASET